MVGLVSRSMGEFCLKIYDLLRHPHLLVDVLADGSVNW